MIKTIAKVFTLTEEDKNKKESISVAGENSSEGRCGGPTGLITALTKMSARYFFVKCIFDGDTKNKKRSLGKTRCVSGARFYYVANKLMWDE